MAVLNFARPPWKSAGDQDRKFERGEKPLVEDVPATGGESPISCERRTDAINAGLGQAYIGAKLGKLRRRRASARALDQILELVPMVASENIAGQVRRAYADVAACPRYLS